MQVICSLDKILFQAETRNIFCKIESNLRYLAVEMNTEDEIQNNLMNQRTSQIYAAFLNKLENGLFFFFLKKVSKRYLNNFLL